MIAASTSWLLILRRNTTRTPHFHEISMIGVLFAISLRLAHTHIHTPARSFIYSKRATFLSGDSKSKYKRELNKKNRKNSFYIFSLIKLYNSTSFLRTKYFCSLIRASLILSVLCCVLTATQLSLHKKENRLLIIKNSGCKRAPRMLLVCVCVKTKLTLDCCATELK